MEDGRANRFVQVRTRGIRATIDQACAISAGTAVVNVRVESPCWRIRPSDVPTQNARLLSCAITRTVAAAIEQSHDERGIIFPAAIAPFHVVIIPIGLKKNKEVRTEVERLYAELSNAGIDVLLDDRDERPGVMFADMELIGIPHRVVIGDRSLKAGNIEYQGRRDEKPQIVPLTEVSDFLKLKISGA